MTKTKRISFTLNGHQREFDVDPDMKLLDLLRREGFKGAKFGCGEGVCGACTVIMDGRAVYSCLLYAIQADGRDIQTIEGVGGFEQPHPVQEALVDEGAVQCGYCMPGMVLSAKAMLDVYPVPSEDQVREHMDGNLCRCTGYQKVYQALDKVIEQNREATDNTAQG